MLPSRAERPSRAAQGPGSQFVDLVLVQLSNWRWAWPQLVITGMIAPVGTMVGLAVYSGRGGTAQNGHILVGALVLALLFQNQNLVAGNFAFMKANGTLDFFAALPVSKALLAVSTVTAFFLISAPALLVTLVVGLVVLHVSLSVSPLLLLAIPLCIVIAAGIGAIIGSVFNTIEESSSVSLVATFVLTACGSVIFPAARLPAVIRAAGVFNPATYAAAALRATLIGPVQPGLILDLAVLAAAAAAITVILLWRMPWRMR
jgi:ABC-2 type transport system permease protein